MKLQITAFKDGLVLGAGTYQQDRVCIGSAQSAHLRVDEDDIFPEHIEIWVDEGRCWVRPLDGSLRVNGNEIVDDRVIRESDRVQVSDSYEFAVKLSLSREEKQRVNRKTTMTFKNYSDISDISSEPAQVDTDYSKPRPGGAPPPEPPRPKQDDEAEKGFMKLGAAGWVKVLVLGAIFLGMIGYFVVPVLYKMSL